jgi:UDP-N-acetylglucosamine 2-epimerase (non-hydrolysing)
VPFKKFGVVTLHRPSNVDDPKTLTKILVSLNKISEKLPIVFPVHPRTHKMLRGLKGMKLNSKRILLVEPLGYIEFLNLVYRSALVITDSGGIQEETTYLGIPCLTLRSNTERPITLTMGTNTLVGNDFKLLDKKIGEVLKGKYKKGKIPPKWDGRAAGRIAKIIVKDNKKT